MVARRVVETSPLIVAVAAVLAAAWLALDGLGGAAAVGELAAALRLLFG